METLFGLRGKSFTLVASDTALRKSVIKISEDDRKYYEVWDKVSIGYTGEKGPAHELLCFVREKMKFESIRNRIPVNARVAANVVQGCVHSELRTTGPSGVGCLIGDKDALFAVDMYGAMWKANYAAMGYAQYFLYGVMDSHWHGDLDLQEGMEILKKCAKALAQNYILGNTKYNVRIITETGIGEGVVEGYYTTTL